MPTLISPTRRMGWFVSIWPDYHGTWATRHSLESPAAITLAAACGVKSQHSERTESSSFKRIE
jgi:hypothetical protein